MFVIKTMQPLQLPGVFMIINKRQIKLQINIFIMAFIKLPLLLLALIGSSWLSAGSPGKSGETPVSTVVEVLSTHFWQQADGAYWQLEADGTAYIWSYEQQYFRQGHWSVASGLLGVELLLTFDESQQRYMVAIGDTQHVQLVNDQTFVELSTVASQSVASALSGEWQSSQYGETNYVSFMRNGQFRLRRQTALGVERIEGFWREGHDGQTVFLYLPQEGGAAAMYVKYIELDELVLSMIADKTLLAGSTDYYFNKL